MAQTTTGLAVTYQDFLARLDPNDKIARIIEMQTKSNPILEDLMIVEANELTGHVSTIRTGLPTATWRMLNYGVQPSKSKTAQVRDKIGMLEAFAQVDKDLAEMNGNANEFRLSEDSAFLEAMNQQMATTLFYGNENVYQERFTGLAPRYSAYSTTDGNIGTNVIPYRDESAGSGSDIYDIFLVVWGASTVHGIYPKGSKAGWWMENLGLQTVEDAAKGKYRAYQSHYQWKLGLCVRDWRYAVRGCNVDLSDIAAETTTVALLDLMDKMYWRLPADFRSKGRAAWYVPPALGPYLQKQAARGGANALTFENPTGGGAYVAHNKIPIRPCDALVASSDEITIS
jgi:hypothetical protein